MSRLHVMKTKLSKAEIDEYIDNMNTGVSNHKRKQKIDALAKTKVRGDNLVDVIRDKFGTKEKEKNEKPPYRK